MGTEKEIARLVRLFRQASGRRPAFQRHARKIAYIEEIPLSEIAEEVHLEIPEAASLSLDEYSNEYPIVVEKVESNYNIVDGFHRTAGLVKWAEENEKSVDSVSIPVIVATHEGLISIAADPWHEHHESALKRIYRDVGLW